ncbi:AGAP003642-PA-like protein [Anopheles sinensis]|uniref:AGAP003642-PA-like protein n=1 Tax=Anopheles sinensis TaxID=74873 RepID=A0A084VKZ3_ANOSI|nr:AGAP003642-PA-like protein [Anopheles sinensis]
MRFLSVEQTLIDIIEWIYHLRNEVVGDPNAKVILHGLGYGGTLAIWARQRFPNLIDGAYGSAASVIAKVNFFEYGEDMGNTIRTFGHDDCFGVIWRGFRTAENLVDAGLYDHISEMFQSFEAQIFGQATYDAVAQMCAELEADPAETALEVLANFFGRRYAAVDCVPYDFEAQVEGGLNEDVDFPTNAEFGIRQRLYQLCTEFGWFLTSSTGDSPFGTRITYRYFLETCRAVFGDWMTEDIVYEGVRLTNLHFGADDPRVTNVVFVNAEFDPTRLLSITNYTNTFANAFVIDRAVVALDWMTPTDNDPEAMQRIQREIEFYINLWVTDGFGPRSD